MPRYASAPVMRQRERHWMVVRNTSGLFTDVWRVFVWKYLGMLLPECEYR